MKYNSSCANPTLRSFFVPVLQTIAKEVEKEMANQKNFPTSAPLTNIINHDDLVEIQMSVPGLSKQDISVSIEKNQLIVTSTKENADANFKRREFKVGSFKKVFNIPDTVNIDTITATTENGILKITLQKIAEKQAKKIEVI